MDMDMAHSHSHAQIVSRDSTSVSTWPAILTIILFFLSNLAVIFPLRVPLPRWFCRACRRALVALNVLPASQHEGEGDDNAPRHRHGHAQGHGHGHGHGHTHGHGVKPTYVRLNFITVPLASVLLLLALGVFDRQTVRDGVLGTAGVQPLNIMALFISLAYMSISLDATGLLRFLAFWVARKGGSSARRLYVYLYLFFLVCGVVVGNDPVILSGTAFLAYFTRVAGITPPTAWIFAQFAAANMASVVLVSSNPTNLVLSGAFSLSFLTYAAHVALPFLAAALAVFPLLLLVLFRAPALIPRAPPNTTTTTTTNSSSRSSNSIDVGLSPAEVRATLVDPRGALVGSVLLGVTLGVLVGTSTVGRVPVWVVTVPPALVMLARDVWWDWARRRRARAGDAGARGPALRSSSMGRTPNTSMHYTEGPPLAEGAREGCSDRAGTGPSHEVHALHEMNSRTPALTSTSTSTSEPASPSQPPSPPRPSNSFQAYPGKHSSSRTTTTQIHPSQSPSPSPSPHAPHPPRPAQSRALALLPRTQHLLARATSAFPTVAHVAARLPIALLPFAFLMFVLVQGLAAQGWVALFAGWWGAWVKRTGPIGAVGGMGFLACVLCNFCGTNIGATILLARVLQLWLSSNTNTGSGSGSGAEIDPRTRDGAIYALALGSNFGAFTLTFGASLAGLLWRQILRQKGIRVRGAQFLALNLPISFVAMLVGCVVLVGQTFVEHPAR
ncbi:hypothetical protein GY45DRAFT_1365430 [Cubamyces sp. BRFM 1775]|nr:hypothetical protein GY45DRAFT_1365430 [Cubamyces sp. BRFM 1775]